MKNKVYTFMYLSLVFFILACNSENKSDGDYDSASVALKQPDGDFDVDSTKSTVVDPHQFIIKASASGLRKIEASKIAQKKGRDEMIKIFANQMMADNSKFIEELDSLAKANKIVVSSKLSSSDLVKINKLRDMDGGTFDTKYISMMVEEHKKDIAMFKTATTFQDMALSAYAENTMKHIVLNSSMAVDVQFNLTNKYAGFLK